MNAISKKIHIIGAPSDLGANTLGARLGPSALRIAKIGPALGALGYDVKDCGDVFVPTRESLKQSPQHVSELAEICNQIADKWKTSYDDGAIPLLLGGDHSLAIGSISAAAERCKAKKKKIGVIWVDAHADINTPESSPSGNIHGMPVATLLGDGFEPLKNLRYEGPKLTESQIVLIGLRNLDEYEKEALKKSKIMYFTMRDLDEKGIFGVMQLVKESLIDKCDHLHLSFDIDGCDPVLAPGVSTPVGGGLNFRESHLLMEMVADSGKLASADLVEVNPIFDNGNKTSEFAVDILCSAVGKSII